MSNILLFLGDVVAAVKLYDTIVGGLWPHDSNG